MTEESSRSSSTGVFGRLRDAGLHPKTRLGQHFLCDPGILSFMTEAAELTAEDRVLEVGTGPGTLTRHLAATAAEVLSVELDERLVSFARGELEEFGNVRILHGDVLDGRTSVNPEVLEAIRAFGAWKLVANLPYQVATPLLLELTADPLRPLLSVVTVQTEVADRLAAGPGSKTYGPASLLLAYWSTVKTIKRLAPGAFWPVPRVTSSMVKITPRQAPLGTEDEFPAFSYWVHRLFSSRRKQIGGILGKELGAEKARHALEWIGVESRVRAEDLSPEAFLVLARCLGGPESGRRC